MKNSDTPRTDAAIYPMDRVDIVWPEFARELERENNRLKEELRRRAHEKSKPADNQRPVWYL